MRVRLFLLALGVLLLPVPAIADGHRADLYGGFSGGGGGSTLFGFHESWAFGSPQPKSGDLSWVVADVSVHFGAPDDDDVTQVAFMAGPRWTFGHEERRHKVFAHFLVGGVYSNDDLDDNKDWAVAFGGGYEVLLGGKAPHVRWGLRVQVDYINRFTEIRDDFPRISGGVIYRFVK